MAFVVPLVAAAGSALFGTAAATTAAATTAGVAATAGTTAAATGILGTGITLGQVFTGLSLLGSGLQAVSQYQQGVQQSEAYKLAATNAVIEGNRQALEFKRQGNAVLSRTLETDATIKARAGASGIDPFSGSAGDLSSYAFFKGTDEYNMAAENAAAAIAAGEGNAASYRMAASSAYRSGLTNAIGTGLMAGARLASLGGAPSATDNFARSSSPYAYGSGGYTGLGPFRP